MKINHTKEERRLRDRFLIAFNQIEAYMQETIKLDQSNFGQLLREMKAKGLMRKRDYKFLDSCRELRNRVIHMQYFMAIPCMHVVETIERLAHKYEKVLTVDNKFIKDVHIVQASDSMFDVMKLIQDSMHTQFPVYDEDIFINLLTENVLTLWLARNAILLKETGDADFDKTVNHALELHDNEEHWEFVARSMTIADATNLFAEQPVLEALIITQRGKKTEKPVGIMTRSDALDMLDGKRDSEIAKQTDTDN